MEGRIPRVCVEAGKEPEEKRKNQNAGERK